MDGTKSEGSLRYGELERLLNKILLILKHVVQDAIRRARLFVVPKSA